MRRWRHRLALAWPIALSVLIGWCGADRPLLKREGLEPMALMAGVAGLGAFFLWKGGGYFTAGAVLFFAAGAYVMRGWACSIEWSIEEAMEAWRKRASRSARKVVELGPAAGFYQGRPIPAWIRTSDGAAWDFAGLAGAAGLGARLRGDCLIQEGLLYRRRPAPPREEAPEEAPILVPGPRRNAARCGEKARQVLEAARKEGKR